MTFYDDMQGIATELLGEFNQGSLVYVKSVPGNGPVDNPGEPTITTHPLQGVAKGVSFKLIGSPGVNGVLIVASDFECTVAVRPDVKPDVTGFVQADGVPYKIKAVINIPPFGVTVAHRIVFGK